MARGKQEASKKARTSRKATTSKRQNFVDDVPTAQSQGFRLPFIPRIPITRKIAVIVLIVILVVALAVYKKHWFVAAIVDGSPVTSVELLNRMNQQYREQTLSQLVNQKLILSEVGKNGIVISDTQLNDKISQLEKDFGGPQGLDQLLSAQRQTRADLKRELSLQLAIEKLYGNEATVGANEIDKFILENRNQMRATEAAAQREEASEALVQQKLSAIFAQKFRELKEKAKIVIF